MELRLDIGPDRLTIDDMIMLEEGEALTMRGMRDLLAGFAVDEDGESVPVEDAVSLVGGLSITDLRATLDRVRESVEEIKDESVSSGP